MSIFEDKYASLYEAVYAEKNYAGEVVVVRELLSRFAPEARSILDFGCGTGKHDLLLAESGFAVTGLDRSHSMLKQARGRTEGDNPQFLHVDEVSEIPDDSMDVVVSLFDVISYLVDDASLDAFLDLVLAKAAPRAPLLFDFWHLPAVVHLGPETRRKTFEADGRGVTRVTEPAFDPGTSVVQATHDFYVEEEGRIIDHFSESHSMRCFSKNEIHRILALRGYGLTAFGTWEKPDEEPGLEDWSVLAVAIPKV